ncbi:MAG: DUF1365 domain-containing protein, partial [Candidatus Binatia bacterium]|nr:DUF1365 domain-containing protein [Candidatus Binatia bacterium]
MSAHGLASAVYEGWVRHRRFRPRPHAFRYRIAQPLIDLDELDRVLALHPLFRRERGIFAVFRRSDYLGPPELPLAEAVRRRVAAETGRRPEGPVRMLGHLRYFGYCFNPVVFYYCHGADGTLEAIVADITNTPWGERHAYVLPLAQGERHRGAWRFRFRKRFHVSPFLPLARDYDWRFTEPGERLAVHMEVLDGGACELDATLALARRPLSRRALGRCLWRFPPLTLKTIAAIHWQAF